MKTAEQIGEFIRRRIGHIYKRPLMYGGTALGVNTILHYYHELLSVVNSREEEYKAVSSNVHDELGCNALGFTNLFQRSFGDGTEDEVAEFVVRQWKKISERLNLTVEFSDPEEPMPSPPT